MLKYLQRSLHTTLFAGLMLVLSACQYDPYAHRYTTSKPAQEDVVGKYTLAQEHLTAEWQAALRGKRCTIELRA